MAARIIQPRSIVPPSSAIVPWIANHLSRSGNRSRALDYAVVASRLCNVWFRDVLWRREARPNFDDK